MRTLIAAASVALFSACGIQPDPPPQIDPSAYGGMGEEMARCMRYASESYCKSELWGGRPD